MDRMLCIWRMSKAFQSGGNLCTCQWKKGKQSGSLKEEGFAVNANTFFFCFVFLKGYINWPEPWT